MTADTADRRGPEDEKKSTARDTTGWLTREQSARLVGVAVQTIKAYEERGLLHPIVVTRRDVKNREHSVTLHDPQEVVGLRAKLHAKRKPGEAIDTSTWVTRNEACDSLSLSTQTLKNYEQRGMLHPARAPRRDSRGHEQIVIVYDPNELTKLPRGHGRPFAAREPGELEAQCFQLIEEGKSNREIVIALRMTSDKVREVRERWQNDGGTELLITCTAKDALETLLGPFQDVTDLIALVTAMAEKTNAPQAPQRP